MTDKEIKNAVKTALGVARKQGYFINDDAVSDIGLAITVALKKWTPERGAAFDTFVTHLAIHLLQRRRKLKEVQYDDTYPPILYHQPSTKLQEYLLCFDEPDQSIAWLVWVYNMPIIQVSKFFKLPPTKVTAMLDRMAKELREYYNDPV